MKVIEKIKEAQLKDCACVFNGKNPKAQCLLGKPCGKPILKKGGKK